MHISRSGNDHNSQWTADTQAVLSAANVGNFDPNRALTPQNYFVTPVGPVVFAGPNPPIDLAPQNPGFPNPTLPAIGSGKTSKDDGAITVTDAAGNVTLQDIPLSNGGFQYIDNDIAGLQPWTTRVSTADALGVISATTFTVNAGDPGTIGGTAALDTINASITYTLGTNVENLFQTGTAAINGTGNALDNYMVGNDAANTILGLAGNDTLYGQGGNDTIDADGGNDILYGGAGADILLGKTGNDTYVIDNLDTVTELAGGGTDTVWANFTYTIGANIENIVLTGAANINATGDALPNYIYGNDGNNILKGDGGNDVLYGGLGNDTLRGEAGIDTLFGGTGAGVDSFYGGTGGDRFVYTSFSDSPVTGGSVRDYIQDFEVASDKIVFTGLGLTASGILIQNTTVAGVKYSTVGVDANHDGGFGNGEFAISVQLTGTAFVTAADFIL
jgi:Ca2+-binding RTX toxin-like protein